MSRYENFDFSAYLQNGDIRLENLKIENCKISGQQCRANYFKNCCFHDVLFEYSDKQELIIFEDCEFTGCVFQGDLKETSLAIMDSLFKDCTFEHISLEFAEGARTAIKESGFFNCNFKDIRTKQEIYFANQTVSGGKMENVSLLLDIPMALSYQQCSAVHHNLFSDVKMDNVCFMGDYDSNVMDSVDFAHTTIEWILMLDNSSGFDNNEFYKCDVSGLNYCRRTY